MLSSTSHQTERKRGDMINLKTDLKDVPINPKLYKVKRLSVSELINQPAIVKKKFSIASFANSMRRGILNTSSMIRGKDLNKTEADLTPFNTMEVLSGSSFTSNLIETERKIEYVRRKDVKKNIQDIGKWKVLLTEAGGSGNDKIVLGDPVIARPNSVCTQSYLYIPVNNRNEACNLIKYIKTRFVRFLVSSIKITQHAQANVYEFVPLQDFTKDSDIDWSKSIDEIDNQLYAKYGIEDEIDFIRSIIKPM